MPSHPDIEHSRAVAHEAMWKRIPPVRPDEFRHHLADNMFGEQRARDNTAWWRELSGEEQRALIDAYPREIGNAEGIAPWARTAANEHELSRLHDDLRSRQDAGERLTRAERKELDRYSGLQKALDGARGKLSEPGDEVHVLAFDPREFHGDGRMVVSVGQDPFRADSVSWHVPGFSTTINSLAGNLDNALNHLTSVRMESPGARAASITWIGYDAPQGLKGLWDVAHTRLASAGGDILHGDLAGFNAARDALIGDGSRFSNNDVFGHSYGSTTTGFAGHDGRLSGHTRSVTLLGSPGAGPLRHAAEFGVGDHVFVASSSRDFVTMLGGRSTESHGRFFGRGLGLDPAMEAFGARRVTAEFPRHLDTLGGNGTTATHSAYYRFDPEAPGLRTESLANFGRIGAGMFDQVHPEHHRRELGEAERGWWRTEEPALGRPLENGDPAETGRRIWDPHWHSPDGPDHHHDNGEPPEPGRGEPPTDPPSRDYDASGHTIPTDRLNHPHADLLDQGLLAGAAADPNRINDALAPGAPSTHPEVQEMLSNGYDPYGGLGEDAWKSAYWPSGARDAHGNPELVWPDPDAHPQGFGSPEGRTPAVLDPGRLFDRFGPAFGVFGSPVGTPFPDRGLPQHSLEAGYHRYEVLRPIPIWEGEIAPAMGQPGGGIQYYFPYSIVDLVNAGYLREIPL